ncbi:MAG: DegT/DnrJ/EryC1/StrS family aminotransferase [Spirochaetota bacterium]
MKIPVAKPYLIEEDAQAAHDVILSGWVTQGPKVETFENEFAMYIGASNAVAVSSCTTALHLALVVAGVGPGDEVICPSMSFIATANAIVHAGAIAVFAEVGDDYNLDVAHVSTVITKRTKAVLLVHQLGMPADIDAFRELCDRRKILLIEDAACAAGSEYKGQKVGSHSDFVCFSFHPRKVITTGDGGMITVKDSEHARRLRLLRQHGMSVNDRERHASAKIVFEEYLEVGYNFRMTDIQAAVGITQLKKLDRIIEERRKIALRYHDAFRNIECLRLPLERDGYRSNYQTYSVYLNENAPIGRDELMQKLLDEGISTRRGVMTAHREKAYAGRPCAPLPRSEDLADRSIVLPLYVPMNDSEQLFVINTVRRMLQ